MSYVNVTTICSLKLLNERAVSAVPCHLVDILKVNEGWHYKTCDEPRELHLGQPRKYIPGSQKNPKQPTTKPISQTTRFSRRPAKYGAQFLPI